MAVAYKLTVNTSSANRVGADHAYRIVTDTTRRVLNRAIVLTPVRFGYLRGQNKMSVRRQGSKAIGEVFNTAVYATAVHDGTPAYDIVPKKKKALRFEIGGEVVFAKRVRMPARRGRPWLLRALREVAVPEGYRMTR